VTPRTTAGPPRPLALVTGASSGIGEAFARRLARDGYDLVLVARRAGRLAAVADALSEVTAEVIVADLATRDGIDVVADICATWPISILVNNAGVAHYMPLAELPAASARELVAVKALAPVMLTRAALPGMIERGAGTIISIAGMLAFSGPAPATAPQGQRAVYVGTLAGTVAMSQTLAAEIRGTGVGVHVVCPGVVATEFHSVQGMDLSAVPRMSAEDVVTATLAGIELGETVICPGLEDPDLLTAVFDAELAAFGGGQRPELASRYRADAAGR
jgi:uncharacterized protein